MKLVVGPLDAAAPLCAQHRPSHLVSWLSPTAEAAEPPPGAPRRRLLLRSNDIAEPHRGLIAPNEVQVAELLAFADGWNGARPMLIHCWAGISRSTAAAYVIACRKRPDLDEGALAGRLRSLSPEATPNPLIVALADDLLGRDGRMSRAIRRIGRGAEAACGRSFVFACNAR